MRVSRWRRLRAVACAIIGIWLAPDPGYAGDNYAIAMHGAPALPADFTQMPYANPDAPKGGRLVQGILGTFDSLNPLIVRGVAVQQVVAVQQMRGAVIESLMGTLLGWPTGNGRGCAVFMGVAARQGPSTPSPVLFQGSEGRGTRPAHGAVRPQWCQ